MLDPLLKSEKLQQLHSSIQEGSSILIEELWNAPKALVTSLAQKSSGKNILILTGGTAEESRLYHDFPLFTDCPVVDYPAWETLPNENIPPSPDIVGERYQVLNKIAHSDQPHIVISSLTACLQRLIPPAKFESLYLKLKVGESFPFELFIEQLTEMGYQRSPVASDKGEFAVRGGIIDVFPVSSPDPFRIEFFGDDIESLRIFDPIGQKSVKTIQEIEITAAQEMELISEQNELSTIIDYLGTNTLIIFDDLLALEDRYAQLTTVCGKSTNTFSSIEDFLNQVEPLQKLFWAAQPIEELTEVHVERGKGGYYSESGPMHGMNFHMFNRELTAKRWQNPFIPVTQYLEVQDDQLLQALPKLSGEAYTLTFLCPTESDQNSLQKRILDLAVTLPSNTNYEQGYLSTGFVMHDLKQVMIPLTEITHRYKIRRQKLRSTYHTAPSEAFDISPGEMVVHLNNGIGKFLGIERRPNHLGVESEFFIIEYADQAKLFVPINQAYLITKYIGSSETIPELHTIGSKKWQKAKETTQRAIMGYATDLLKIQAERELSGGFSYPDDSDEMIQFEEDFAFTETEDQLQAIEAIKTDFNSNKAMDRLVCGDVGYGKTEIAMRTAFKAVIDGGKQIAVLVPTTVLAMQHYDTFVDRMRNFPVNIGILSRFQTAKQTKETIDRLAKGSVDIVIGTHRIISKDIVFKDLGLVIIDEEQRFGVRAKEHLKKLKTGVDCLTLSATPIPRTLYMSLIGARDLSVINTPPQDRLPIKTVITDPFDDVIKKALLRELARDGQAFFIHNRVETIYEMADRIKKILPGARVAVGHGQLHADELDMIFHAFKQGEIDILVATTIVENGIDIPNANTILIDQADHFGLAELYQLRGRVGRWNRRAYCYFLVPQKRLTNEMARRRLNALAEASGYGGGMKLAMRDLEIRGAGDILGTEQSGQISAIGFHLYCKLLKRTVKTLEGKMSSILTDTKIDFPFDARLPEDYINETRLRMEIYQRLGEALTFEEVDSILRELKDRFGPIPKQVRWLYHITRIRTYAAERGYTLLRIKKLTLITEQKKGKESTTRTLLIGPIRTPEEMEEKILEKLN